jgi:hypothetical protein
MFVPKVACPSKDTLAFLQGAYMASYKAVQGISTSDRRIEIGDVFDSTDLPASSIKWLAEQGLIAQIEESTAGRKAKRSTTDAEATVVVADEEEQG